jgi:hypothetical protein
MHISPESGRYDHLHGDEEYRDYLGPEALDIYDVIFAIEKGGSTTDGTSHHEWIHHICAGDEITTIMQHIIKNRHNPAFAEIMNEIELAIEGWLP